MRRFWVPAVTVFLLTVTACGGQSDSPSQAGSTASATVPAGSTSSAPPGTTAGPVVPAKECAIKVSSDTTRKPTVTFPKTCEPPKSLISKDIVTGTGPALTDGQTAVVQYVGISLSNRAQFDASWDRNQPFPVQNVGQAGVIDGWNQGLPGMKKGGRRLLLIPPDLGYGPNGNGPIAPNETLVFVIDLVSISG